MANPIVKKSPEIIKKTMYVLFSDKYSEDAFTNTTPANTNLARS